VIFGEFMRNVWKNIFIGPRYQYRKLIVHEQIGQTPGGFEVPAIDLVSTTAAIGFHVARDLRDSVFYPTKGSFWDFKADFFAKPLGSNRTYQTYKATYNGYLPIGKKQVLAYRGVACSVSDRTPFFDLCLYGASSDLRGYPIGKFQDHRMLATQVEYRRELKWRLGVVGFAGVGGVARHWGEFRFDELLPAAGAGLRFKLDKTNLINYRIDLAYGRGGHTLSMSVTEAF
jgi:outer membrane protein assembly factor BamA